MLTGVNTKPNVVIFFTDQQRWDCSGLHGNPLELMPNFDRIAHQQTHLFNSFTCQPVCGPARSCLQTGQYATTTGVWQNALGLKDDARTIAHCFNEAGYHTGYIGKWHLAGKYLDGSDGRGLSVLEPGRGGWQQWLGVEAQEFSVHEYHAVLYDNDGKAVHLPGYRSDAVADAGIRFIDQHQDKPFALMMSFIEPHHQNDKDDYPAPDGYRERYTGRWTPPDLAHLRSFNDGQETSVGGTAGQHLGGYYGMVKRLDEGFGRVMDALKSLGLEENTIVLFTSDHGCHFKTRNSEYKRSCHETSIRVPTLLAGGPFAQGRCVRQLVSLVDLAPTLLEACGIEIPSSMQGRSIMPLLRGETGGWPEEVYVQISEAQIGRAVRTSRWKYSVRARPEDCDDAGGASTYHEEFLYDLKHDPYELRNLIDRRSHSEVRRVMRERLLRRMREAGEAEPVIVEHEVRASGQLALRPEEIMQ